MNYFEKDTQTTNHEVPATGQGQSCQDTVQATLRAGHIHRTTERIG